MKKLNIKLPLRKVKLPTFNKTKKYYEQIDKNLIYSNNGPLVRQLKKSLAEKFNIDQNYLTITSNGTVSLKTILRAIIELKLEMGQIHEKNFSDLYCLVPSFTFVASAMSIIESGLQPIFIDIEGDNGLISPITVKRFLEKKIVDRDKIIAIMPVSPFGAKINKNQWVEFKNEHDIEIVYDEAWCFDSFNDVSLSPSAISLHASKSFGCGEGGLIISKDTEITNHCKKFINFGFDNNKISQIVGTKGKMSEYNAAVALANLDEWPENKSNCINLQKYYLKKN